MLSKIYKEPLKFKNIKTNYSITNLAKDLNGHLTKENIQMGDEHMKRRSILYVIREMQIKKKKLDTITHIIEWPKSRGWQHQELVRMWSNRNSHSLLVAVQSGTDTLRDSLVFFLQN